MDPGHPLNDMRRTRLFGWRKEPQPPFHLDICPTDRCNLRCIFCSNKEGHAGDSNPFAGELPDRRWLDIVGEGLALGARSWRFVGGGEPLLRHGLVLTILKRIRAHSRESYCEVHTNGTLLDRVAIEEMVMLGLDTLTVSMSGATDETQDRLSAVQGSFQRITTALHALQEVKAEHRSAVPEVRVRMVICSQNAAQAKEMMILAAERGVSLVDFIEVRDFGVGKDVFASLRMRPRDRKALHVQLEGIFALAHRGGVRVRVDDGLSHSGASGTSRSSLSAGIHAPPRRKGSWPRCLEPWYVMYVDASGNVGPCCVAGNRLALSEPCPSVRTRSLADAWKSDYLRQVREAVLEGRPLGICEVCPLKNTPSLHGEVRALDRMCNCQWRPAREI